LKDEDDLGMLGDKDKKKLKNEINDLMDWVDDNPKATQRDLKQKKKSNS